MLKLLTKLLTKLFEIKLQFIFVALILSTFSGLFSQNSDEVNLRSKAIYNAKDSIVYSQDYSKAYMYNKAFVEYDNIVLEAAFIEIDFNKNELYATPLKDSTGNIYGKPVFKEGSDEFNVDTIRYNFDTKKGIVKNVRKKEGELYTWTHKGKKMPDDVTYADKGHFTTCNADHPHFRIVFKKGKIIPKDKIVTGPIYMEIGDIPLPFIIPFSYLPNKQGRANGLIFPTYGYAPNRGYNLRQIGYYTGLGRNADLALTGDIYSRGSYAVKLRTRYNVRYKYNGNVQLDWAHNKIGDTDVDDFREDKSFFVRWSHRQSPKANPNGNFSASANFGTKDHNRLNSYNIQSQVQNEFSSSIAYSTKLFNKYNLTINLGHSQNSNNQSINIRAPEISFSTPRFNPFKRKIKTGKDKWYEKIKVSYRMNAKNKLNTIDSVIWDTKWEDFENGVEHKVPLSYSQNIGFFNWSVNANLNHLWYFKSLNRYYQNDTIVDGSDTLAPQVVDQSQAGFKTASYGNISTSLNTRIYGMFNYKKGPLKAIRHVLTPNLNFSFRPDFGTEFFGYYKDYINAKGDTVTYSVFEGGMFGGPPNGKSGSIGFSLSNNLEIKVRNRKDTANPEKKVKIIENLTFSTSYDLAKEEFNLAPLSIRGRTKIIEGLSLIYSSSFDFYALDSTGQRINKFNWEVNEQWLRNTNSSYQLSFNYRLSADKLKSARERKYKTQTGTDAQLNEVNSYPQSYVDFNVPWSFNVNYSFRYATTYNKTQQQMDNDVVQTLGLNGDINITNKWKIGFRTGWDFLSNELSATSIDIYRDLHCWELIFNWIPMGFTRSYNLTIRAKAPMLQDLKLNKRKDWRDY